MSSTGPETYKYPCMVSRDTADREAGAGMEKGDSSLTNREKPRRDVWGKKPNNSSFVSSVSQVASDF